MASSSCPEERDRATHSNAMLCKTRLNTIASGSLPAIPPPQDGAVALALFSEYVGSSQVKSCRARRICGTRKRTSGAHPIIQQPCGWTWAGHGHHQPPLACLSQGRQSTSTPSLMPPGGPIAVICHRANPELRCSTSNGKRPVGSRHHLVLSLSWLLLAFHVGLPLRGGACCSGPQLATHLANVAYQGMGGWGRGEVSGHSWLPLSPAAVCRGGP